MDPDVPSSPTSTEDATSERPLARRGVWLSAFAAAAALLVALTWRLTLVFDDAFISFRYSKHLANGDGLRFNLGVEPPVEGYSNLLWVLWCAIPERLALSTLDWALWSNLLCGLALLACVLSFLAKRLRPSALTICATALFLAVVPAMAVYSTGGLETMAFALALFLTYERLFGERGEPKLFDASLAGAAAVLLRPDGILWVGVLVAMLLLRARSERGERLRNAALIVGVFALGCFLAQTALRIGYHGDWLPNTVRAKSSMSAVSLERGGKYALAYLLHHPTIALVLAVSLWQLRERRSALVVDALLFTLAMFVYVVLVGGDFLPMGRFLLPAVPFIAILFAESLERCALRSRLPAALGTALILALTALPHLDLYLLPRSLRAVAHYNWNLPGYQTELELLDGERRRSEDLSELGRGLQLFAPPGSSVVLGTVGAVGYYSDLFIHDQFGLVDREVAALPGHGRRLAAGHDRYAPAKFFAKYSPTYEQVSLIDVDDEGSPLDEGLRERAGRTLVPLDEAAGFRPGKAMLLIEGN